jgi:hypothetical protein
MLSGLYSDYSVVNPIAFRAGDALWVFATHPSKGNGHFNSWVSGSAGNPSGQKRVLALEALKSPSRSD